MLVRLLALLAPDWPKIVLAGMAGGLTVIANAALIATSAYLISFAALHPPLAALSLSIAGVRFFGIARAVLRYTERLLGHAASLSLLTRLQVWFYASLEPHVPAVFAGYRTADLWQRLVNDVETLKFLYVKVIHPPLVASVVLLATALFAGHFSLVIMAVLVAGYIISGIVIPLAARRYSASLADKLAADQGLLSVMLTDAVLGMEEIAAHGMTDQHLAHVAECGRATDRARAKLAGAQALAEAASAAVANLTVFIALLQSVLLVQDGYLDGVLLAVIPLVIQCSFEAVWPMAHLGGNYTEMRAAAGRLFALIDKPAAMSDGQEGVELNQAACDLSVEGISFAYPGRNVPVLSDISFFLPRGGKLAVVGPSGAGKSTLAALLLRFADYNYGHIYISGQEIRKCRQKDIRNVFGVVNQDTYLFHATIRDNLLLARPTAGEAEIWDVLRQAHLAETVAAMPMQLETVIGRDGQLLSGGERQRLAIARALLKDAPVLLLDEPATGLDAAQEQQVMNAVYELPQDKSLILITHRLLGLEHMDEILVINGRIVERGTMDQLCRQQGLFYQMLRLQRDRIRQ